MDRIEIRDLRVFGRHGVLPEEQRDGQTFVIDVALAVDLTDAARSDALEDTVDYGTLATRIADAVASTQFDLIETLAGHLADLCLQDPRVEEARVRVGKPQAPIPLELGDVAVVLTRSR